MDIDKAVRTLQRLVVLMRQFRSRERRRWLEAPGKGSDARAVANLRRALKVEWDSHRCETAADLRAWLGDPATLPLGEALQDADAEIRWRAAWALGRFEEKDAVPALCQALAEENGRVRLAAAEALARMGDARAIGPLIEALKRPRWETRRRAVEALEKLRDPCAVEPLCEVLRDYDPEVRWRAAMLLGRFGGRRAVLPLSEALHDDDWSVRSWAIEALGKTRDDRAAPPLIELLRHADWGTRRQAAVALEEIGPAAVLPLCEALRHEDDHVRGQAALLLGKIGDARAVAPLCDALGRGQVEAAVALGAIARSEPVPDLVAAVPLLHQRLQLTRWFDNTETQRTLTLALQRIETALAETLRLPIPAAAPLSVTDGLPVPASPPTLAVESLPVPAGVGVAEPDGTALLSTAPGSSAAYVPHETPRQQAGREALRNWWPRTRQRLSQPWRRVRSDR
jgi:HEAT repeat protein